MKKRLLAFLLACILPVLAACADSRSAAPSESPAQTPTPAETTAEAAAGPVTRADYPAEYLPGIGEAGAIPKEAYHIGIVIGASSPCAANLSAFEALKAAYEDAFGMTVTIEQPDDAAQPQSITKLLNGGAAFLIIAPGGGEPLAEADALCAAAGVPYLTVGRRIAAEPGENGYVCTIEPDWFLSGVLAGQSIAETMTAQYGEAFGNIAEITGEVSDDASVLRSSGLRYALSGCERLNVVCSVAGGGEQAVYDAAVNIFKAYREGELDGIVVGDDSAAVTVLQAALDYDRNDVPGRIWSAGATVDGLTGVYYGQLAQTVETASQTGMAAMEYAVRYLNGETGFPPVVTALTRAFAAQTQAQKDGLREMIAALKDRGAHACLESVGDYVLFAAKAAGYPQRYDAGATDYLSAYPPYTTQRAIYARADGDAQ